MHKHISKKYGDFIIDINVNNETIYAYWTNGDIENSRRFSGYSINEIVNIIKDEINTQELMEKIDQIVIFVSLLGFVCLMLIIGIWG